MDCDAFLNRIDEFVDGIPGVADDPSRVAHVKACALCTARVRELELVAQALPHGWSDVTAPATLRNQVRRALAEAASTPKRRTGTGTGVSAKSFRAAFGSSSASPASRSYPHIFWALAAAAVVVLALGAWQAFSPRSSSSPMVVYVENDVLQAALVRHRWCCREEHVFHRDGDLPNDLPGIASTLKADLGLEVLAPDLRAWGYSVVGARRCRVSSRPVAHLLYFASRGGTMLSLFSMYRVHDLGDAASDKQTDSYFSLAGSGGGVLAWNDGLQTYALIGSQPQRDLVEIGESLRDAGGVATLTDVRDALAVIGPWR